MKDAIEKAWNEYKEGPTDEEKKTCPSCKGKDCSYDETYKTVNCPNPKCRFNGPPRKIEERKTKPWWDEK
jgi:hypothetical protein